MCVTVNCTQMEPLLATDAPRVPAGTSLGVWTMLDFSVAVWVRFPWLFFVFVLRFVPFIFTFVSRALVEGLSRQIVLEKRGACAKRPRARFEGAMGTASRCRLFRKCAPCPHQNERTSLLTAHVLFVGTSSRWHFDLAKCALRNKTCARRF